VDSSVRSVAAIPNPIPNIIIIQLRKITRLQVTKNSPLISEP
jgi:hypothetical protein